MGNQLENEAKIIQISTTGELKTCPTSVFFVLLWSFLWPLPPNIIKLLRKHIRVDTKTLTSTLSNVLMEKKKDISFTFEKGVQPWNGELGNPGDS